MTNRLYPALVSCLALLLVACTSVPFDYPRQASEAMAASPDTPLGQSLENWYSEHGELSGFFGMQSGMEALGARLALMEQAQQSIDAQYFLIKPDEVGALFLGKLLRAANRGVRVRLLIDDIFTPRMDSVLALLNTHPKVEVRLFNPLSRYSPTAWNLLWDFKRTNRRMHNKSFTVDGSFAIVGGRNIADEYFELKPQHDFEDYELLVTGEIVSELAASFDVFWNSELAVPMEAFGKATSEEKLDRWLTIMDEVVSGKRKSAYSRATNDPLLAEIRNGERAASIAPASVVYDPPDKLLASSRSNDYRTLAQELRRRFELASEEIIVVTPYFVPRRDGMTWIKTLLDRGIRVVVITNSLASTNHVAVHSGYARYRKPLLEAGMELYELKVDESSRDWRSDEGIERVTLHTKAVIIDRRELFVGSLNFDPRSIALNTEVGLFIQSEDKAAELAARIARSLKANSYRLALEDGRLRWHYLGGAEPEIYSSEPQSGFWRRFKAGFYSLLPIEGQL